MVDKTLTGSFSYYLYALLLVPMEWFLQLESLLNGGTVPGVQLSAAP